MHYFAFGSGGVAGVASTPVSAKMTAPDTAHPALRRMSLGPFVMIPTPTAHNVLVVVSLRQQPPEMAHTNKTHLKMPNQHRRASAALMPN